MSRVHGKKTIRRRSKIQKKSQYSQYREELREDFNEICGYCGKSIHITRKDFEIDHFVPKIISSEKEHLYENLVYCCFQCNRKKKSKWPTQDPNVAHNGEEGFIDPATPEYDNHLERSSTGAIIATSAVGCYMIDVFKLQTRPIKEIWQAMQLYEKKTEFNKLPLENLSQEELVEHIELIRELDGLMSSFFETRE